MSEGAVTEIRTALARAPKGLTARQLLDHCDSAEDLNEIVKRTREVLRGLNRAIREQRVAA